AALFEQQRPAEHGVIAVRVPFERRGIEGERGFVLALLRERRSAPRGQERQARERAADPRECGERFATATDVEQALAEPEPSAGIVRAQARRRVEIRQRTQEFALAEPGVTE